MEEPKKGQAGKKLAEEHVVRSLKLLVKLSELESVQCVQIIGMLLYIVSYMIQYSVHIYLAQKYFQIFVKNNSIKHSLKIL